MKKYLYYLFLIILILSCKTTDSKIESTNEEDLYLKALNSSSYTDQLQFLNKAIEINPYYYDALYERGKIYLKNGEVDLAIIDLEKLTKIQPNDIEILKLLGQTYTIKGDYIKAKKYLITAFDKTKEDVQLLEYLSDLYYNLNDYVTSLDYIEKAIVLENNNPSLFTTRGNIQWALGEYQNGIHSCDIALSLDQDDVYAVLIKIVCNIYLDSLDEAEKLVNKAQNMGLPNVIINKLKGFINFQKGNYPESEKMYLGNVTIINEDFENGYIDKYQYNQSLSGSYLMLSMVYYSLNDIQRSKEYYTKLITIDELYKQDINSVLQKEIFTEKEINIFKEIHSKFN